MAVFKVFYQHNKDEVIVREKEHSTHFNVENAE